MKKNVLLNLIVLCVCLCFGMGAFGAPTKKEQAPTAPPAQIQPQPIDFSLCNKSFKLDTQTLFYLTLAGVNANRFEINEFQSKNGLIVFTVAKKQYLASVVMISPKTSMLKITPCDNVYIFPVGIVQNMFKYIELNLNTPIEKLGVV